MKNKLFQLLFFVLTGLSTSSSFAGTGDGGILTINNKTDEPLRILWGGLGCAGESNGYGLICEYKNIPKGEKRTYKYNWGVTTTWFYAFLKDYEDWIDPCGPTSLYLHSYVCVANKFQVRTHANIEVVCDIEQTGPIIVDKPFPRKVSCHFPYH